MAPIVSPGTCRAEIRGQLSGELMIMRLHFNNGSAASYNLAELTAVAGMLETWLDEELTPEQTSNVVWREMKVTDLTTVNGLEVIPSMPAITGKRVEAPMPNNVALCVSHRTGVRGRNGRGRTYVGGVERSLVSANTFDQTWVNQVLAAFDEMRLAAIAVDVVPVVLSTVEDGAPRPVAIPFTVTTYLATDLTVDSMRNRLPGRGR